jgi:hypothetical protein
MAHLAFFFDDGKHDGETNLFSAEGDAPRIGDTVSYRLHDTLDKNEWDPEIWKEHENISGNYWKVVNVYHEYRKYHIFQSPKEVVHVYVKPVESPDS